jgi:hypothetical protein
VFLALCPRLIKYIDCIKNPDSSVGIETGYGPDGWFSILGRSKNFIFSIVSRPDLGAHPAFYIMGPGAVSQVVKQPGHEADHSPPASAEIKKLWIYTSTPPYAFMA